MGVYFSSPRSSSSSLLYVLAIYKYGEDNKKVVGGEIVRLRSLLVVVLPCRARNV